MLLYSCKAVTPFKILFNSYESKKQYQDALSSHIKMKFEIPERTYFSNYKNQLKKKQTFDNNKVGQKEVGEFQVGELLWLTNQNETL